MISISKKGVEGIDEAILEQLRQEFSTKRCIYLPRFIQDDILQRIMKSVDSAAYFNNQHEGREDKVVFATDLSVPARDFGLQQVNFLFNNSTVFNLVEQITGKEGIKGYSGRIYKNVPGMGHRLDWHDDLRDKTRMVALSVNLGKNMHEGGIFQIRKVGSEELLREVVWSAPGDAHLFDVSPQLQHRVTETTGQFPRIAAAGWFLPESRRLI